MSITPDKHGTSYRSAVGYTDFQEVLQNKDVDAVEVGYP